MSDDVEDFRQHRTIVPPRARKKLYPGIWRAIVSDNNDPQQRGRLQLVIPEVTGDQAPHPKWAYPTLGLAADAPPKGDAVHVLFLGADPGHPVWLPSWLTPGELPAILRANYPNRRGWVKPTGNHLVFDDSDAAGDRLVELGDGFSNLFSLQETLARILAPAIHLDGATTVEAAASFTAPTLIGNSPKPSIAVNPALTGATASILRGSLVSGILSITPGGVWAPGLVATVAWPAGRFAAPPACAIVPANAAAAALSPTTSAIYVDDGGTTEVQFEVHGSATAPGGEVRFKYTIDG